MGRSTPTRRRPVPKALHGFVDESARPNMPYLVCAAVIAPQNLSRHRAAMKAARAPGAKRVHMESDGRYRQRIVATVAEMDVHAWLYIASTTHTSQRRARTECFRRMVPDLIAAGVGNLYIESCDQDRADRIVLAEARALATASADALYFDHRQPHQDPMLWIPDVIAWAWGKDSNWRQKISHLVTEVLDVAA